MAFRREKIKRRFEAVIPSLMEAGEQPVAGTFSQSGSSPWLSGIPLVIWIMLLAGTRFYYIQVTDRRVLFIRASIWTARPKGLAWADPRDSVQVHDVELANRMWGKFRYSRRDGKDIRININSWWHDDGQAVVAALTAPEQPQVPQPPIGQP